jgi:hypothetical protein
VVVVEAVLARQAVERQEQGVERQAAVAVEESQPVGRAEQAQESTVLLIQATACWSAPQEWGSVRAAATLAVAETVATATDHDYSTAAGSVLALEEKEMRIGSGTPKTFLL